MGSRRNHWAHNFPNERRCAASASRSPGCCGGGDDADDENKSEKEGENEKESEKEQELEKKSITLLAYLLVRHDDYQFKLFSRSIFPLNELPESELYTSQLELPPEA